jgi:hypothetical protein
MANAAAPALKLLLSIMTLIVIIWVLAKLTQTQKEDTRRFHRGWLKKR